MSKAELEKLFGCRLKVELRPGQVQGRDYILSAPEHFCHGDFQVGFIFFEKPGNALAGVYLESLSGNPEGTIGECVLRKITAQSGQPKITISDVVNMGSIVASQDYGQLFGSSV